MEVQEFKRILDIGLGRAILHLQQHDAAPYRDVILHACLHNTAYDRQVEGTRAEYMLDIIRLTQDQRFYRNEIMGALSTSDYDVFDTQQLLVFANIFAQAGDEEARQAIYNRFLKNTNEEMFAHVILDLDGVKGFVFIAEKYAETEHSQPILFADADYLLRVLEDQEGEKEIRIALDHLALENPSIKAYISRAYEDRSRRKKNRRKRLEPSRIPYQQIKQWIDDPIKRKSLPLSWEAWGSYTSEEDLYQAAADLLRLDEGDVDKLLIYLRLFWKRPFPLDHSRLITWAQPMDNRPLWGENAVPAARIPLWTLNVLKNITHSDIRTLAFSMIESSNKVGRAVELLANNYEEGDWQVVEKLTSWNMDKQDYHDLGFSIKDIFDAHPNADASQTLINLYEHGPCSTCRERFVEDLYSLNALPDWMLEECKYDANLDLREAARSNFPKKSETL